MRNSSSAKYVNAYGIVVQKLSHSLPLFLYSFFIFYIYISFSFFLCPKSFNYYVFTKILKMMLYK